MGDPVPEGLSPFQKPDTIKLDFTNGVPKFLRKPFMFVASRLLKSYPQLTPEKCVGCGKCAESCPAHVIKIENRKAKFREKGLYFLFLLSGNVSHEGYQCKESPVVSCSLLLLF